MKVFSPPVVLLSKEYSFSMACASESEGGIITYLFPTADVFMFLFSSNSKSVIILNVFLHTLLPFFFHCGYLPTFWILFFIHGIWHLFYDHLFTIIPSIIWRQKQPQVWYVQLYCLLLYNSLIPSDFPPSLVISQMFFFNIICNI